MNLHPGRPRSEVPDLGANASSKGVMHSAIGVLLDLAPPFVFLEKDEYRAFRALVEKYGALEIPLEPENRSSFFFPASDKVHSYFIAPREAIEKAHGALDVYISAGFLEDQVPAHLNHPGFLNAVRTACGLLQVKNGGSAVHVIPSAEPLRKHINNVISAHRSRFLDSGLPLERLLKGIATGARVFIPSGDPKTSRMTGLVSPYMRCPDLNAAETQALDLLAARQNTTAVLVFGLDRRGRHEPMAFLPIEFGGQVNAFRIKLPDRPLAFLLPSRCLMQNAERTDLMTHVIDLDFPTITPWELAYSLTLERIADAINAALGRAYCALGDIILLDEDRQKTLMCWIEMPRNSTVPSSSLDRLDRLSLAPDPIRMAPGLAPLAAHAAGERPMEPPKLNPARRLAHADYKFPLDPHQARAATGVGSLEGTWVQSVTGPPGTGKTSMMRDVICDRIARSLIEGGPPSLLLTGPTIQAYENLLDAVSFSWQGVPPGCDPIFPDFPYIGAIIPTSTAIEKDGPSRPVPYLKFLSARANGLRHKEFAEVSLPAQCGKIIADRTTASMIEILMPNGGELPLSEDMASAEVNSINSHLASAIGVIEALHRAAVSGRQSTVTSLKWPEGLEIYKPAFDDKLRALPGSNTSERVEAALDLTLRFMTFHMVIRLAQVRFILAAHGLRRDQERLLRVRKITKADRDALLQSFKDAIAYLLPIRTATVTSLGGKAVEQFGRPACMVIIDEAGMMEPEFVPAVMAEGQCTLAVGDPYQIPPVGTDLLPIHGALLVRAGVPQDQVTLWSMPELPAAGREPAHKAGNGLSIIEAMSAYRDADALVLRRHYRCPASIIEISNQLVYRPRGIGLEAVKSDPAPNPDRLPVLATVLHDGKPDDGANFNPQEADAIVTAFLMHHRAILSLAKDAPNPERISLAAHLEHMAEAVAFISPYRQQAKLDPLRGAKKQRLSALYAPHLPTGADILFEGFLPNLMLARLREQLPGQEDRVLEAVKATIFGTIHALQGAERPVVFLSCVADEKTQFFNKDPSLINVGVTRAQSHLVIARSIFFAAADPPGTTARSIAETVSRSQVILPERLMVVESRDKARPIERALPQVVKVIATRGAIGRVSGLDTAGQPTVEFTPSAPHVAANFAEVKRWLTPADEGGLGLRTLILGTDADDAGETIAHDLMRFLGLDRNEIVRRGLTVTRWPMEDPAALGDMLAEDIAAARSFNPEVTGRWRASRQRARAELRTALSRGIRARLRHEAPGVQHPSLGVLRTMRWLEDRERSGWEVRAQLTDEDGRRFEVPLCTAPGTIKTFSTECDAVAFVDRLVASPVLSASERAVPSPVRTRRSLYDVLAALSWGGVAPLKAMKVLQRLFEKSGAP